MQQIQRPTVFSHHIALPQDHGSWVFLLSPLLIGLFAGGKFSLASLILILACFSAFLIRQPVIIAVKAYSGRRPRKDLLPARFWMVIYTITGLAGVAGLVVLGFSYLIPLALAGLPIFTWHLVLVSKRAERRQAGVEILGSGVLALSAPAAYWVGIGRPDSFGWWLFLLTWFQSAASIVYAYLRLEQRTLSAPITGAPLWRMARRALLYTSFNLITSSLLALAGILPTGIPVPFGLQWIETLWGATHPAIGVKPTRIGIRQLIVSSLFTILFIISWLFT